MRGALAVTWKVWLWIGASVVATALLGLLMFRPDAIESLPVKRTVFLPGATTDGHYQIELACESCHTGNFSNADVLQDACIDCHSAELERVDDSHPKSKFTDPRNADRVAVLDARYCITCHQEHRPEVTTTMGLSLPGDYCHRCHEDIGEDRPTHRDLPFDSCASGGCHNFHDNRALYEDFLVEHRSDPPHKQSPRLPASDLRAWSVEAKLVSGAPLSASDHDAPARQDLADWVADWDGTSHAEAGVNCGDCHAPKGQAWTESPGPDACQSCHVAEREGFLAGRHGMRLAAGLPAMTPSLARLPMHEDAAEHALDCNTCHSAHGFDRRSAAVDACLGCHADDHSTAYADSVHARLWEDESAGRLPAGSGVSCATCHLPRIDDSRLGRRRVAHNQNDFLRPNEKMIRSVCLDCHGLGFSLDALADPALVARNFRGSSSVEVESIHFASVLRWELEGRTPPWKEEKENEHE
ncbi:MAG: cytochrome c3 family protein [Myxococcota bacterium]